MKKVAFYTLGCKLNYSETSSISRMFEKTLMHSAKMVRPFSLSPSCGR